MKRILTRLVPLLLPACTVDTPIVEGTQDRLGEDLGAWCRSICDKASSCEANDDTEACPGTCADLFTDKFIGRNDFCTAAAERVMDCLEEASCSDLVLDDVCNVRAEADHCDLSQGRVNCYSGSEGGSGATGGTGGSAGMGGAANVSCSLALEDCTDSNFYEVRCAGNPPVCQCFTNEGNTGSFPLPTLACPSTYDAVQACHWPIVNVTDDDDGSAAVYCQAFHTTGSAGSGPVGACEIAFEACSNDHTYALECAGFPVATSCECQIDDVPVGTVASPEICMSVIDGDGGVLALYDYCGFEIVQL